MDDEERRPPGDRPVAPHDEAYDLYRRGHVFLRQNHPGQAALLFERARRLAPGKNSIREALGRAYFHLGRYDRAAAEFSAIVEHVPTNDYARYALGRSLLQLGRFARSARPAASGAGDVAGEPLVPGGAGTLPGRGAAGGRRRPATR